MTLKGKTALITGSTSGIGLGIAHALAREGASIVLNGFSTQDEIERVESEIKAHKVRTLYHAADMSQPVIIETIVGAAEAAFGQVDLVNNAGIQHVAPVESFPTDRWDAIIAINLSSAFHTTGLVLPNEKKQLGTNYQYRFSTRPGCFSRQVGIRRREARGRRAGEVGRAQTAQTGVTCNHNLPRLGLDPVGAKAGRQRAARDHLDQEGAKKSLLFEKQPSLQFVTRTALARSQCFYVRRRPIRFAARH